MTQDHSCIMVVFGASGDLMKRKLFPSLFNLAKDGFLPERFALIGVSRQAMSTPEFRSRMVDELKERTGSLFDQGTSQKLIDKTFYFAGDSTQAETYPTLKVLIDQLASERGISANCLFYLATPPELFDKIPILLSEGNLVSETNGTWKRVVIEKPFGRDFESARALNLKLSKVLKEEQIYRIDHYLGKETVQNIMVLRFANGILEPLWNQHYIHSIQITVAEAEGIGSRGRYYDKAGALRDMIPNHLFQLVALIGMEPPNSFDANDVRNEKVKVIEAISPVTPENVPRLAVRGQYKSYRSEPWVSPDSCTETFVALRLEIDNWRWAGIPIYLRTGKRLAQSLTDVVIRFCPAPFQLFRGGRTLPCGYRTLESNLLKLQIQPQESITLSLAAKVPGPEVRIGEVEMNFNYEQAFRKQPQTGYETLIYDCIRGDATLFQRADQIEAGWKVVQPILDYWSAHKSQDFPNYEPGSWGPEEALNLLVGGKVEERKVERPSQNKAAA